MNDAERLAPTYVTRLTTVAPAAIAVIELSGPSAESWLQQCWRPAAPRPRRINSIRFGAWVGNAASDSRLDSKVDDNTGRNLETSAARIRPRSHHPEEVVICWTEPETVEIHCHGGQQASERILHDLMELGAASRSVQSWIDHAIRDPLDSAAWMELASATTEMTTAILLDQSRGALSRAFAEIREWSRSGRVREAIARIDELLARRRYGMRLTQAWRLAIIGPPNAGKSSLLNAVLGYSRAIVDASPGTTRDALNEPTCLLGWPFLIVDTAGLRDTTDSIEREGVQRALAAIDAADLVLLLVEPQQGWTLWHDQIQEKYESKCLVVHSKADLGLPLPPVPSHLATQSISALTHLGIECLYQRIIAMLIPEPPQPGDAVPFRIEHCILLEEWRNELRGTSAG